MLTATSSFYPPLLSKPSSPHINLVPCPASGDLFSLKKRMARCCQNLNDDGKQNGHVVLCHEEKLRRRFLLFFSFSSGILSTFPSYGKTKSKSPYDERRLLEQNKRIQKENNAPEDFPSFIREGFEVKDGQQVTFHYVGYNESGRRIDSTYLQGSPSKIRMGTKALIPGFEEGIRDMRPGGKRRIIIPPELGPPVGPSTFFSSKQFEVFDVELLNVKDCQRRTIGFYSDVVCN
ncbi:PEPTIDYL-PROLYL CIS-TRANS ISOMERASE FKBP20-2 CHLOROPLASTIC [Salix purpurea]|uniref:peptidylprolyl isomerase n=1 Tax=Salix purpurea TaxID=77065 RepID=A0A9Q0SJ27_SALPP|nr:PEPTIDYL-PROLYL CIS-TRANS ISOMERASE FKBP20-2 CHLOROPLASTIC [Salix purpurea]